MKKILISVGPIPARVDSVKFITNVFKGGLALKTAEYLSQKGNDVTIVAWEHTKLETSLPIIAIKDVMDYYHTILASEFDAYILAGAVANLMPSNPYQGKFPSHNYQVGEKFQIEFEIAPRVIDEIKKKYPRSTLIGYKLFDGDDESLIKAAKVTLHESKANLVFANHPKWAKEKKIVLTQDGSIFQCSFDEHCDLMHRLIQETFYKTIENKVETNMNEDDFFVMENYYQ
jgi:phosphopantothenoylcysteine synthetase/decarboxylase